MSLNVKGIATPEQRAAELLELERQVERDIFRTYVRAAAQCFLACAVGLALVAWSVHTTDYSLGLIAFWGGLLIGNGMILITLVTTHRKAESEGWL